MPKKFYRIDPRKQQISSSFFYFRLVSLMATVKTQHFKESSLHYTLLVLFCSFSYGGVCFQVKLSNSYKRITFPLPPFIDVWTWCRMDSKCFLPNNVLCAKSVMKEIIPPIHCKLSISIGTFFE